MYDFKQGSAGNTILVGIADAVTGLGVTGLANNANTFKLKKPGVAAAAKTFTGGEWVEIGNGWYEAALAAADVDTLGMCCLVVIPSSGPEGAYPFQVVANTAADVKADTAAIKAKTDALPSDPADNSQILDAIAGVPGAPTVGQIADAVWDEALAGHVAAGTFGESLAVTLPAIAADAAAILVAIKKIIPFGRSRATVLTRDPTTGAPLTTQVYTWDTDANYAGNGVTGRAEYLVTTAYHASGHITTHSVAPV